MRSGELNGSGSTVARMGLLSSSRRSASCVAAAVAASASTSHRACDADTTGSKKGTPHDVIAQRSDGGGERDGRRAERTRGGETVGSCTHHTQSVSCIDSTTGKRQSRQIYSS